MLKVIIAALCCFLFPMTGFSQQAQDQNEEAIAMVSQIYEEVSGKDEQSIDWDKVRAFFADEAVIVLRTSREETSQFTVEEFIQDFKNFYQSTRVSELGFKEEVLQLESEIYHDMAFVAVVYAAAILDSERPPQKGVDFWLLARRNKAWKVVAVTNEVVPGGGVLPGIFK